MCSVKVLLTYSRVLTESPHRIGIIRTGKSQQVLNANSPFNLYTKYLLEIVALRPIDSNCNYLFGCQQSMHYVFPLFDLLVTSILK